MDNRSWDTFCTCLITLGVIIDRTAGLKSEMDKLGFEDTPENRAYFEKYSSDVF